MRISLYFPRGVLLASLLCAACLPLSHYRALLRLRSSYRPLRTGEWHMVQSNTDAVYAFLRSGPAEYFLQFLP